MYFFLFTFLITGSRTVQNVFYDKTHRLLSFTAGLKPRRDSGASKASFRQPSFFGKHDTTSASGGRLSPEKKKEKESGGGGGFFSRLFRKSNDKPDAKPSAESKDKVKSDSLKVPGDPNANRPSYSDMKSKNTKKK